MARSGPCLTSTGRRGNTSSVGSAAHISFQQGQSRALAGNPPSLEAAERWSHACYLPSDGVSSGGSALLGVTVQPPDGVPEVSPRRTFTWRSIAGTCGGSSCCISLNKRIRVSPETQWSHRAWEGTEESFQDPLPLLKH